MSVTITIGSLANETRVSVTSSTSDVSPYYAKILEASLAAATILVEGRAPNAPEASQNKAVVQIVGYWLETPPSNPQRFGHNAWLHSGAAQILGPFIERRAQAI